LKTNILKLIYKKKISNNLKTKFEYDFKESNSFIVDFVLDQVSLSFLIYVCVYIHTHIHIHN